MMKRFLCILCALLLAAPALAELPATSSADFFLFRPENASAMEILWHDGPGEPRVVLLNVPETYRDEASAFMKASPAWRTDLGPCGPEDALALLTRMGCTELPELPGDMTFEGVCFWADGFDFAAVDAEQAAFMLVLASVSVALNGQEGIDTSLRMGYYDMDTGTLLMATWVVE